MNPLELTLSRAVAFAVQRHGKQVRKGTTIPYVSHLLQVAGLVLEHGGDLDQAAAGMLHDVVEDTTASLEDVELWFGPDIAAIVADCTDTTPEESYGNKRPWRERKSAYLDKLRDIGERSALVIACDKLHNTRTQVADLDTNGIAATAKFNAPPEEQRWLHHGLLTALSGKVPAPLHKELAVLMPPPPPANGPRPHAPKGTRVAIIREEHGWHDGQTEGVLIDDHGTVRTAEGYTYECRKRRDYYVID